MRYGIFSDVHSNLEAFEAVLDAYKKEKIDQYIFAGDIVGYGANPKECIKLLREINPQAVCGNHDWGAAEKTPLDYFNDYARQALIWTRDILDEAEIRYLADLKLIYKDNDLTVAHASLDDPQAFEYILDLQTARKSLEILETPLGIVGHSHVPFILVEEEGYPRALKEYKVKLQEGKKYLVNCGSVGQPRDLDPRAAYCVYDTQDKTIEIKRLEYDIKTAQEKILDAGLPKNLAYRLGQGT